MIERHAARLLAAAAAPAVLIATPALAQDPPVDSYSGFYIAGTVGAGVRTNDGGDRVVFDTNLDGSFTDTVRIPSGFDAFGAGVGPGAPAAVGGFCNGRAISNRLDGGCTKDRDRVEYSGKLGYDRQFGSNLVAGVLAEGATSNATDYTTAFSRTPASYTFSRGLDYAISGRGRVGYTPNGKGLFYATGGVSYAKLEHRFSSTNVANSFAQLGGDKVWGWQAGGGAELMVAGGLGINLEYLYSRYDDKDYFVAVGPGTAPPTNPFLLVNAAGTNMRPTGRYFTYQSLRAGLFYKF